MENLGRGLDRAAGIPLRLRNPEGLLDPRLLDLVVAGAQLLVVGECERLAQPLLSVVQEGFDPLAIVKSHQLVVVAVRWSAEFWPPRRKGFWATEYAAGRTAKHRSGARRTSIVDNLPSSAAMKLSRRAP